jgi:hypothetical protein
VAESILELEITILMPCLNEAETLATCIDKAKGFLARSGVQGEVMVADNGSTDGSQEIAISHGARVVPIPDRGYGAALLGGITAARGKYVIMGDADDSYDFSRLGEFVTKLREGYDLVMGNRFRGGIAPGAMPTLHRYLGNPVLSGIGRLFFSSAIGDFHCGLRGFRKAAIVALGLRTTGMEFASEMVVKSRLAELRMTEVPTTLAKDGRSRPPHLRSWRDGWRHLRFLLMYSPRWLFLFPGLFLLCFGLFTVGVVLPGPLMIGSVVFDVHTLLVGTAAILTGSAVLIFFFLAKQYATNAGLLPTGPKFQWYRTRITLERTVLFGVILSLAGVGGIGWAFWSWGTKEFGKLDYETMLRLLIPSATALSLGVIVIMGSFLSGIMDLPVRCTSTSEALPQRPEP